MLFSLILVGFMALIFYYKDIEIIRKYIEKKTISYINYLNESFSEEEDKRTNILINSIDSKLDDSKIKSDSKSKSKSRQSKIINENEQKQVNSEQKGDIMVLNKLSSSKEDLGLQDKKNNQLKKQNKKNKEEKYLDMSYKEDFSQYLAPNIDDQEFDDIILQDKRNFKQYFMETLNEKQLFVNTFNVKDNFRPMSLKLVIFTLTLVLYCVINGFFYGEDAISEIYHIKGDDPFFGFFPRSITRYVYCTIVGVIISVIIDLFFVEEKKMKGIFNREKRNIVNLKVQIANLNKEIFTRYIAFLIFVFVLFIFLMFYLLCFNYVYPHTQGDWIKSSIFLIIIIQILSILVCLIQTGLRFIGFRLRSEKIFKLSKLLD